MKMTEANLPTQVAQLTTSWLTSALREAGTIDPTTTVLTVRSEPLAEGVGFLSYLHRLHLELDGGGPATLVVKLPTDTAYLQLAQLTGAYEREVTFYSEIAPASPIRTPKAHVARFAPGTTDFVLLMDDLGGLDAADHLVGLSRARTEQVIDGLADFHAWAWGLGHPAMQHPAFPSISDPVTAGLYSMGIGAGWAVQTEHGRTAAPDGLAEIVTAWADRLPPMLAAVSHPATLLNGDLRADNLFFAADGSPVTVDFQLIMRGAGVWDVAYLVGQGMTTAERAGSERELVQRYVDRLAAAGITGYGFEDAWLQFRISVVAQITLPLTAMMSWPTLNDRAKELLHALMERAFAIIEDTDALSAVPA